MRTEVSIFSLFRMVCVAAFAWALFGCGGAPDEFVEAPMADALRLAQWPKQAEALPPAQSVGGWLAENIGADPIWTREPGGDGALLRAQTADGRTAAFLWSAKDRRAAFLDADIGIAYRRGLPLPSIRSPLAPLPRHAFVTRQAGGGATFRYEGCFVNSSHELLNDMSLRATLLIALPGGRRQAFAGKARRSTRRSGIPARLAAGETFCVSLRSGALSKAEAADRPAEALGVVEAHWRSADGRLNFGPAAMFALDWSDYAGRPLRERAVIRGGRYPRVEGKGMADVAGPELTLAVWRQGDRLQVQSVGDGAAFVVGLDDVAALFPEAAPPLETSLAEALEAIVRLSLSGVPESAAGLFVGGDKPETLPAVLADLRRRFPADPPPPVERIEIVPLEIRPQGDALILSYFTRAWSDAKPLFRSYDVLGARKIDGEWRFLPPAAPASTLSQ
ncbi:MAG: hypothetical protein C4523_20425 [Myxococcales bacterium]|nr:MAG: hypothetical protein C4523_20425 [Myxococcales bacterium]